VSIRGGQRKVSTGHVKRWMLTECSLVSSLQRESRVGEMNSKTRLWTVLWMEQRHSASLFAVDDEVKVEGACEEGKTVVGGAVTTRFFLTRFVDTVTTKR
jgi:hypothetical protein